MAPEPYQGLKVAVTAFLDTPFKDSCFGLEVGVSSQVSVYLTPNFHNLEVSLIDYGPELCLLAYFMDSITPSLLYFAPCFCLLISWFCVAFGGFLRMGID